MSYYSEQYEQQKQLEQLRYEQSIMEEDPDYINWLIALDATKNPVELDYLKMLENNHGT